VRWKYSYAAWFGILLGTAILLPSKLIIICAITMPIICYLSAYKKYFRHLFFIPVLSILIGVIVFIFGGVLR